MAMDSSLIWKQRQLSDQSNSGVADGSGGGGGIWRALFQRPREQRRPPPAGGDVRNDRRGGGKNVDTVESLRSLYSSLLDEIAPHHQGTGTGGGGRDTKKGGNNRNSWRWKNRGTVIVDGSDEGGYDYAFEPDRDARSWRLSALGGGINHRVDWSNDGIRRYHTGGVIVAEAGGSSGASAAPVEGSDLGGSGDGEQVGTSGEDRNEAGAGGDAKTDEGKGVDGGGDTNSNNTLDPCSDAEAYEVVDGTMQGMEEVDISAPPSFDEKNPDDCGGSAGETANSGGGCGGGGGVFESLNEISVETAWRLRSASPTPEQQMARINAQRIRNFCAEATSIRPGSAILRSFPASEGMDLAAEVERRTVDAVAMLGELICRCERRKWDAVVRRDIVDEDGDEDDGCGEADAVFAYFCEKNVLAVLVGAALSRPPPGASPPSDGGGGFPPPSFPPPPSPFSGVAWTPAVKSQILQTLGMLVLNASSETSLAYLLSNNHLNELIHELLPLDRWTDSALDEMMPPYVNLLRSLALKLAREDGMGSILIPLCLYRRRRQPRKSTNDTPDARNKTRKGGIERRGDGRTDRNETSACDTEIFLPLLHAAVDVFVFPRGTMRGGEGCLIRTTAMNVILNLCRIPDPDLRSVLIHGNADEPSQRQPSSSSDPPSLTVEQQALFGHVCENLTACYARSVRLAMASLSLRVARSVEPSSGQAGDRQTTATRDDDFEGAKAEASARHANVADALFAELRSWLSFLDDLLSCGIRAWNVRLCELVVREVLVKEVLFRWGRAAAAAGGAMEGADGTEEKKASVKARAETRASICFFMQLFSVVGFAPLIRMAAVAVLHEIYPRSWCHGRDVATFDGLGAADAASGGCFFVVTPMLNAIAVKGRWTRAPAEDGAEAEAGVGGGKDQLSSSSSENSEVEDGGNPREDGVDDSEIDRRAMGTMAAELELNAFADELERKDSNLTSDDVNKNDDSDAEYAKTAAQNQFVQNPHRSVLLKMLEGDNSYDDEDTILASMLLGTILESDAVGNATFEAVGVSPFSHVGKANCTSRSPRRSPFEESLARYLRRDISSDAASLPVVCSYMSSATTFECISSVGLLLLERIVHHSWAEEDQFLRKFKLSKLVQSYGVALSRFSSLARRISKTSDLFADFMEMEIEKRYSKKEIDREGKTIMVCPLNNFCASNLVDDSRVFTCDLWDSKFGRTFNHEVEETKFAIRMFLHTRSLFTLILEQYERLSSLTVPGSIAKKRWYKDDESVSFRDVNETVDDILLEIGGFQIAKHAGIGTDIDLRGRTFFRGSLATSAISLVSPSRSCSKGDAHTPVSELVLLIDPSEFLVVTPKRGNSNKCKTICAVPLRTVIACATEGALLHITIRRVATESREVKGDEVIQNGKVCIRFESIEACLIVKDTLDRNCAVHRAKIDRDIDDMLEKWYNMGSDFFAENSLEQAIETSINSNDDSWSDFQQAH